MLMFGDPRFRGYMIFGTLCWCLVSHTLETTWFFSFSLPVAKLAYERLLIKSDEQSVEHVKRCIFTYVLKIILLLFSNKFVFVLSFRLPFFVSSLGGGLCTRMSKEYEAAKAKNGAIFMYDLHWEVVYGGFDVKQDLKASYQQCSSSLTILVVVMHNGVE